MQNIYSYRPVFNSNDTLIHYGVKGMKWDQSKKKGSVIKTYKLMKDESKQWEIERMMERERKKDMEEVARENEKLRQARRDKDYKEMVRTFGKVQNYIKKVADNPISKFINKNILPKSKLLKGIQEAANKLNASYKNGDLRKALREKMGIDV